MADTIFHKIVKGELPAFKVWEDDKHLAFLDIFPRVRGQVLVIPKADPGDYLFDMPEDDYRELLAASQKVAKLMKDKLAPLRILMVVEGFGVPYVHIRLYPAYEGEIVRSYAPGERAEDDELAKVQSLLTS
jgi:histidine triad (HIT) family protein